MATKDSLKSVALRCKPLMTIADAPAGDLRESVIRSAGGDRDQAFSFSTNACTSDRSLRICIMQCTKF